MRRYDILIAVNTRNSFSHVSETCNILVAELRSRFSGKCCDLFQCIYRKAVNEHKYALSLMWFLHLKMRLSSNINNFAGTHFAGGWVGPRACLDWQKISSPPRFDPGPSSPYSVTIPTELPSLPIIQFKPSLSKASLSFVHTHPV